MEHEEKKSACENEGQENAVAGESCFEGRDQYDMDIDRWVNEGLGGGQVTIHNGLIASSTTDTMTDHADGDETD